MPRGIPLTEEEHQRRRHQIFDAAVRLFFDQGFVETSMRQIAEAAGMGKSSLYDYFHTKDEILLFVFEEELSQLIGQARITAAGGFSAEEKVRRIMTLHLAFLITNRSFYLRLSLEAQRLSPESQRQLQSLRHTYQDLVAEVVASGVADGSFHPVEPLLVSKMLLSIMAPTVFTTRPVGTPQEMLDASLDIILRGLCV